MKQKYILMTLAGLVLLAIILYNVLDMSYRNFLPYKKLPAAYEAYKYIEDLPKGEHYQTQLLLEAKGTPITENITAPYYIAGNNTVILCVTTEVNNAGDRDSNGDLINTYYKLNADGDITDSLVFKNEVQRGYQNYLISDQGFYTWIVDGNKNRQPFKVINKNATLSKTALMQQFKSLYSPAECVFLMDDMKMRMEGQDGENAIILVNKQWIQVYGISDKDVEEKRMPNANNMPAVELKPAINNPAEKARGLYVAYFHREHFDNAEATGFGGSPNGSNAVPHWEGKGYINLLYKGDTLKIKRDMEETLDYNSFSIVPQQNVSRFYTHPNIKFGLYTESEYETYIIKPIKK